MISAPLALVDCKFSLLLSSSLSETTESESAIAFSMIGFPISTHHHTKRDQSFHFWWAGRDDVQHCQGKILILIHFSGQWHQFSFRSNQAPRKAGWSSLCQDRWRIHGQGQSLQNGHQGLSCQRQGRLWRPCQMQTGIWKMWLPM